MTKKFKVVLILVLFLLANYTISFGSSSTTYLYLDSIKVEESNIEIVSNEMIIDTTTSKIENTIYLKNTSDKEIEMNLAIPLENEELNISIKDLVIKLNDVQVEYVKGENGNYLIKTRIFANSSKKINIEYFTENNLQKARLIKCNFDNLKGKKVGRLRVDIKIDDKNIPLIEKIYPGHYTFKDNTISVEYYNYEANTITKNIIVKKETFNNLLYGRESNLYDEEKDIINTWYLTGEININKYNFIEDYYKKHNTEDNGNNKSINSIVENIIDYSYIKRGKMIGNNNDIFYEPSEPLLYEMYDENPNAGKDRKWDLKGKKICIDYVETEEGKDLYVDKVVNEKYVEGDGEGSGFQIIKDLVKVPENTILKTKGSGNDYTGKRGAKIIFIGQGIDGENLKATEQEKISYINQINADMYIRIEIYDGTIGYKIEESGYKQRIGNGMVGYYDNNNSEVANAFALCQWDNLVTEQVFNNSYHYKYHQFYLSYDDYFKNYYKDYYKDCVIKLENEDITDKCEVPTVVQFIGNRINKDGKYVIEYFENSGFYDSSERGLITTNVALQTSQAKKMLSANKQKNSKLKEEIENEIINLSIVDDEQKIQQSIKDEIEELKRQEELKKIIAEEEIKAKKSVEQQKIMIRHIIVFSSIGLGIIFCMVIIIIEHKKKNRKKREKANNEEKGTNKN